MAQVIDFQAARAARQQVVAAVPQVSVLDSLLARYPDLEQGRGCVVAAKNIRKELKKAFPGVKFAVRCDQYSGGNSIKIRYLDGPKGDDVEAIVNKYEFGKFDGMVDMYEFSDNAFADLFGGTYYVFVNREYSQAAVERAIANVVAKYGDKDVVGYDAFKRGDGYNRYPSQSDYGNSWQSLINCELSDLDCYGKGV